MKIYDLIEGGFWGGNEQEIDDSWPVPTGWTSSPLPEEVPDGMFAKVGPNLTFILTEQAPPEPVIAAPMFPTLTRKQLRNGLLSIGVTSADVEAQIAAIPDPLEREAAMIDWQDTQTYQRDYPMINQIGAALGLPEEQIDALWLWSASSQ